MRQIPVESQKKFWERVERRLPDECWTWRGAISGAIGYGYFYVRYATNDGKVERAHRVSYALANGTLGDPGDMVMHTCDNPLCVNPNHLKLGTRQDNVDDMVAKKRNQRGERHYLSKLTDTQVQQIIDLRAQGATYTTLKKQFGISSGPLIKIFNGRRRLTTGEPVLLDNAKAGAKRRHKMDNKLEASDVLKIWELRVSGDSIASIADRYDLHVGYVRHLVLGKFWTHLLGTEGAPELEVLASIRTRDYRLSKSMVSEIKAAIRAGGDMRVIAKKHRISQNAVFKIATGKTWSHIP